jgi:hypothetical protein
MAETVDLRGATDLSRAQPLTRTPWLAVDVATDPVAHATLVQPAHELSLDADVLHVIAIGDPNANLLWVAGDAGSVEADREMGFEDGAAGAETRDGGSGRARTEGFCRQRRGGVIGGAGHLAASRGASAVAAHHFIHSSWYWARDQAAVLLMNQATSGGIGGMHSPTRPRRRTHVRRAHRPGGSVTARGRCDAS